MAYPYEEDDLRNARTQGLLAAAMAAFGAKRGSEYNALGQAGLLGLGGYNASLRTANEARDSRAEREMRAAEWAQKQQQWAEQQRQQKAMQLAATGAFTGGTPAVPGGEAEPREGGMTPGLPAYGGQFNPQAYISALQQQGLPQQAVAAAEKYRPKEKEVKETRVVTQNGKRVLVNIFKDGSPPEILPFDPDLEKPVSGSNGRFGNIPLDPYTLQPLGQGLELSASPDARLNDARQREANAISRGNAVGTAADSIRKEFNGLGPVQAWSKVQPVLQSAREAFKEDTPAADLNLTYAVAKIVDPESVVRESETTMVVNTGSPAQKYLGMFNYVAGGGRLTPEVRKGLMSLVESRSRGYESAYNSARKTYSTLAQKRGVDAADVFIEPTQTATPAAAQQQPAPSAKAPPAVGEVRGGYRFKGGSPADRNNWERV
jgi:hypothetical protein